MREADGVAAPAGLCPGGIVDVELPELDTKGVLDGETLTVPHGVVHVPGPG